MSGEKLREASTGETPRSGFLSWARLSENTLLSIALALLCLIPLVEIVLRKTVHVGISGASSLVQHLTLISGMLGAAIAARDKRLISLSTLSSLLPGRARQAAAIFSGAVAAAITIYLCVGSWEFVMSEREAGKILAYGIPVWAVQAILPAGFGVIACRLLWSGADRWKGRVGLILLTVLLTVLVRVLPFEPSQMVIPALLLLLAATVLGAPIFVALGGAALILFWGDELPIASISLDQYRMVTNPSLPTIPLFTLAGYFLAEGGASKRLIRVFQSLVGWFRGGPAVVTVLVCAFFTSFTGASGVTILALGGLLMPVLIAARYSEKESLGLLTGSGSLGLLFPPCLPLILYAIISKVTIEKMFLGGILPGVLMVAMVGWWGVWKCPPRSEKLRIDWREAGRSVWAAKWELLLPVVALTGLFAGFATPVEAAALTALYAFFVETVVYRDLNLFRDVPRVMTECGLLVGGVLLILGVALGFTNYLVDAQVPANAVEWVSSSIRSPLMFLLLLNVFLILVGTVMDIYSAIVVVVPLIVPMGVAFGIDPIHLGIIFLANLELGYLTPPVGMNLFLASYRFGKPLPEIFRAIVPMLLVRVVGVLLITYVPFLSTLMPRLFAR